MCVLWCKQGELIIDVRILHSIGASIKSVNILKNLSITVFFKTWASHQRTSILAEVFISVQHQAHRAAQLCCSHSSSHRHRHRTWGLPPERATNATALHGDLNRGKKGLNCKMGQKSLLNCWTLDPNLYTCVVTLSHMGIKHRQRNLPIDMTLTYCKCFSSNIPPHEFTILMSLGNKPLHQFSCLHGSNTLEKRACTVGHANLVDSEPQSMWHRPLHSVQALCGGVHNHGSALIWLCYCRLSRATWCQVLWRPGLDPRYLI